MAEVPNDQLNGGVGFQSFLDATECFGSKYNIDWFMIWSVLCRISTATLVQVKAVTNEGGLVPVGFVDIQPLVNQVDGNFNAVEHGTIYRCPYFRLQGGANAVILDPVVDDIGIAIFADRDISSVVANCVVDKRRPANPGSRRRFDMSDGLYLGGVLNGVPTQYVRFSGDGLELMSGTAVHILSPALTHNGVNVGATHVHAGVTVGGGNTLVPH